MARALPLAAPRVPWGWAVAGALAGLLVALPAFAPASWLVRAVERWTNGHVVLADARGTVWRGSAQLMLAGGAGSNDSAALPTRVDWRIGLRPTGLVARVASACCTTQDVTVRMSPRWGGAHISVGDSQSHWPAALLAGLGTPWNTLQIEGDLQLATQGLSVEWVSDRLAISGRAELTAQRLSSRLSTLRPMGSYRITVQGGATPGLQLSTLDGGLQLSGTGQWVGSRLHFNGVASAVSGREGSLDNLLNIIGRRAGSRSIITIG